MVTIRIDAISVAERHVLNKDRVAKYRLAVDSMAPVVVFDTDQGFFLADGHHRLAAAQAEGRVTIEGDVRIGSRNDALDYAVKVGAAQRGLSEDEVRRHVIERHSREA